jgi:hypothetical protein
MNNIIIYKEDREKISIYFSHGKKAQLELKNDIYQNYKHVYIEDSNFQLICSQKQTEFFTFYRNCKILEIRNKIIYFEFDNIEFLKNSELIKMQRKDKLKKLLYV